MYERHFGLDRRPFAATPDPDCFVPTESAGNVLDELIRCMESGEGIAVLTGPAGVGKSLLCRRLADELSETFTPVFLANSNFPTRRSLLQAILYELQRPYARMAEQELRLELTTAVRELFASRQGLVLIVDEAHLLSARLLEEVRTITNLSEDGSPLVRVVLCGQLLLEENLAEPELASLNQRIACQVSLAPLSHRESAEYINARVEWAGGIPAEIFAPRAMQVICQASDGSPRCINQLCDHSLMLGYVAEERPVSAETVYESLEDLKQLPLHWNIPTAIPSPLEQLQVQAKQFREEHRGGTSKKESNVARQFSRSAKNSDRAPVESVEIGGEESLSVAAIEIGGPEPNFERPAASTERRSIQPTKESPIGGKSMGTSPAKSTAMNARDFEEEVVIDRYAALDASQPPRRDVFRPSVLPRAKNKPGKPAVTPSTKGASVDSQRKAADRRVPAARDLDQAIEGILSLVKDALDTSSPDGKPHWSDAGGALDSHDIEVTTTGSLTISVETDASGNLRVQDAGNGMIVKSAAESISSSQNIEAERGGQMDAPPRIFDVVLPDDDDDAASASPRKEDPTADHQPAEDAAPAAPRPHRPYEQLFSELRRRRGA